MSFYSDMQAVATELLTDFDQGAIVLTRNSRAAGTNAWTPGADTPTTYNLNGVVKGVSRKYIDGRFVLESDLQATVAVEATNVATGTKLTFVPDLKTDFLMIGGKRFEIIKYQNVPAAGTSVAVMMVIRG